MNNKNKQRICKILLIMLPLSLVLSLYFYNSPGLLVESVGKGDNAYIFFYGYTALVAMLEMTLFIAAYYHYQE